MASLAEDIHINELGRGLSWNDFQKYYRGYQNGEVAKRWQAYNLLEGPGPANPRPPPVEKIKSPKSSPSAAPTLSITVPLLPGRSGRARKANSLYLDGAFALTAASSSRMAAATARTQESAHKALWRPYEKLLKRMIERWDARPFARQMSELWDASELMEYFAIVEKPIDLRTVQENLLHQGPHKNLQPMFGYSNDVDQLAELEREVHVGKILPGRSLP